MKRLALLLLVACGDSKSHVTVMPDGQPDAFVIYECNCGVLGQFGCSVGEKCTWGFQADGQGHGYIACAATGSAAIGEPCTYTVSQVEHCGAIDADNCVRGAVCVEGTCEAICDSDGGEPMCDAQHTCVTHPGLFQYGSDTPYVAGVCE